MSYQRAIICLKKVYLKIQNYQTGIIKAYYQSRILVNYI